MPQNRFASIHVVGTNGKSSVAEAGAALLEAQGLRTGTYLSPHVEHWRERVWVRGVEIGGAEFAAAVERTAEAVEVVNRSLDEGESVTQFEACTAAAFVALAAARVEVGVIEAGLGGRLDATNVLPSRVTALTSIGLDHTEWLGTTELEIAAEKLAVLRDHSTLVLGRVGPEVEALAERTADEHGAGLVRADRPDPRLDAAPYQRRNFAVAVAAATALAGELDEAAVSAVAEQLRLAGRMEVIDVGPEVVVDAAHNADGARAVAEALPAIAGGRSVVACLAVLADKDVAGIVNALAPTLDGAVCTEIPAARLEGSGRPGARALPAAELAELCRAAGLAEVAVEPDPERAVTAAIARAAERGGIALCAGSHYLLGYAWTRMHGPNYSR